MLTFAIGPTAAFRRFFGRASRILNDTPRRVVPTTTVGCAAMLCLATRTAGSGTGPTRVANTSLCVVVGGGSGDRAGRAYSCEYNNGPVQNVRVTRNVWCMGAIPNFATSKAPHGYYMN